MKSLKESPKAYILILDYNNWWDTIECLESVLRNDYTNYQVIVIDNGSPNNSMDYIKAWAEGRLNVWVAPDNPLRNLSYPPVRKPIPYIYYTKYEAEKGGDPEKEKKLEDVVRNNNTITTQYPLIFVQTGTNLGFAGGNNVGIRYARSKCSFEYVWLLNNDTVIKSDALTQVMCRMQEKPNAGICGSTLLFYHEPGKIWAQGGATYNKWFALPKCIGCFWRTDRMVDVEYVESKMNYVAGAAMLISRSFLDNIGLMSEDYFLYFEEIDWSTRARGRYTLAYAPDSIVYHKVGRSISGSVSDYYSIRNRLVFTRKFFPLSLPTVCLGLLVLVFNRIRKWQWDRMWMFLKIAINLQSNKIRHKLSLYHKVFDHKRKIYR